jgi:hypothetical protein
LSDWQKLLIGGVSNFSVALAVSGIVALVVEGGSTVGAVSLIASGAYLFAFSILQSKYIEERS